MGNGLEDAGMPRTREKYGEDSFHSVCPLGIIQRVRDLARERWSTRAIRDMWLGMMLEGIDELD